MPDPLRPLKLLVTVMTVMLLVGGAVLAWGIARQLGDSGAKPRGWGMAALGQPPGTRVLSETAVGSLMVLRLADATGDNVRHLVVDPASGAVLGTFRLGGP